MEPSDFLFESFALRQNLRDSLDAGAEVCGMNQLCGQAANFPTLFDSFIRKLTRFTGLIFFLFILLMGRHHRSTRRPVRKASSTMSAARTTPGFFFN